MNTAVNMTADETVVRWQVIGYRVSVFQAAPGEPYRPGSSCQKCGAGIKYVVTVKSTDGDVMDVGTDCAVTLKGGPELREIRNAERAYERALYLASPEYKERMAREETRKAAMARRAATAEIDHAFALFGLRTIIAAEGVTTQYERDRAHMLLGCIIGGDMEDYGNAVDALSDDDANCLARAAFKASVPASKHVGTVGSKIERTAMLTARIPCETAYGRSYLNKFVTAEGESLVWFSAAGDFSSLNLGQFFTIRGTVKAHKEYQGNKETALTRCKLAKV